MSFTLLQYTHENMSSLFIFIFRSQMSQQPPVVFPMSRGALLDIAHQNSQSSDENLSFGKTLKEWPSIHLPRRCAKNKFLMIFFVLLLHPWESQHPAVFISVQRGSSRCCLPIFTVFRWKILIWEDFERVYFFIYQ